MKETPSKEVVLEEAAAVKILSDSAINPELEANETPSKLLREIAHVPTIPINTSRETAGSI